MSLFSRIERRRKLVISLAALSVLGSSVPSLAVDTWVPTTGGTWNTAANWNGGAGPVPASGVTRQLVFNASGTDNYTATNDIGAYTLNKITLNNTGTGTITLAPSVAANTLTLAGTTPGITNTGSGAATITNGIVYSTNSTVTNSGAGLLSLNGTQTFNSGVTATYAGTGNIGLSAGAALVPSLTFANNSSVVYTGSGVLSVGPQAVNGALTNITFANNGTYNFTNGVNGGSSTGTFSMGDNASGGANATILYNAATGVTMNFANYSAGIMSVGNFGGLAGTININAGTVRFGVSSGPAINTGGDLFGGLLILNVAAGATFDFNGNGESMGAVTGGGIIKGAGVSAGLAGTYTWSGNFLNSTFATASTGVFYTLTGANSTTGNAYSTAAGSSITIGNGATAGSIAGMTGTTGVANVANAGALIFNRSDSFAYAGVISGVGTVTKQGAGILTLTGVSTSTGATTISAGGLRITSGNTVARPYTLANGTSLAIVNTAPATPFAMSDLTLGTTGTTTLGFEFNGATIPTAGAINATGSVTAAGTVNVSAISVATPVVGTIPLIKYSTLSSFAPFSTGTLSLNARTIGTLVNNTAGSSIDLQITSVDTVKWNGSLSSTWDQGTAVNIGGTNNFKLASDSSTTNFVATDSVTFDDTAAGNFTVDLTGTLSPANVTVNNSTNNYTFQGSGTIAGTATLTKQGTGSLTLLAANTNAGITTISGGTLSIGNGGTSGSLGTGAISVAAGATLGFNRSDNTSIANVISGTGTITKTGAGTTTLLASSTGFTGTININGGTLMVDDLGAGGDINAVAINVNSGGKFLFGPNGNADLPDTTSLLSVAAGGEAEFQQGENFGAVRIQGGILRLTGAGASGSISSLATAGSTFNGFAFESGSVIASNVGATGNYALTGTATNPLTKSTSGTVTFTGPVAVSAATPVNLLEGVLQVDSTNLPGTGTAAITFGGATTAGTLQMTSAGSATVARPVSIAAGGGTIQVDNAAGNVVVTGALTGTGPLTKAGAGTLSFAPLATFTGTTAVNAGTLRLSTGTAGGNFSVASGATLTAVNTVSPATLNLPGLTLSSGTDTVRFELVGATTPTIPLINITTADALVTNGGTHNLVVGGIGTLTPGLLTLIDYSGAPISSGFSVTLPSRTAGTIVYDTVNTSIGVQIGGVDTIKWSGSVAGGVWDAGTAADVGGTFNWKLATAGTATNFIDTDTVAFDDTATGFTVNLNSTVQPTSVTINNSTNVYTIQGTGAIAGAATLNKLGTGSATVSTNNTYSGQTTVSAGSLSLSGNNTIGAVSVTGGSLDVSGSSSVSTVSVSGGTLTVSGTLAPSGTITTSSTGTLQIGNGGATGTLTATAITDNGTVTINRSDDVSYAYAITGTGNLNKLGTNTVTLTSALGITGTATISGGTLALSSAASTTFAGTTAGAGTLNKLGAGQLSITGSVANTGGVTVSAGTLRIGAAGTVGTISSPITLISGSTLSFNRTDNFSIPSNISGTGAVTQAGTGKTTLTGALNYVGTTSVSAGTLELANTAASTLTGTIAVAANTLNISGSAPLTLNLVTSTASAGTINKSGTGLTTLLGASSGFTGTVNVTGGTFLLDDQGSGGDLNATAINVSGTGKFIFGPNGNADFPDTTFVTVGVGGEFDLQQGETYGATRLQGGTLRLSGGGTTANSTGTPPFAGFALESGSIIGGTTAQTLAGSATNPMTKTTTGTVTFTGPVTISSATPININEGTLQFSAGNVPASGTAAITLGTPTTAGTLSVIGAGTFATARAVSVQDGGGTVNVADAGATLSLTGVLSTSSAASTLTKTGPGTLGLAPVSLFTGNLAVSAGAARFGPVDGTGSYSFDGSVNVANGAKVVAYTGATTVGTMNIKALSLGTTSSTIGLELNVAGVPTVPLLNISSADGLKTNGGTHTILLSNSAGVSNGTYTLIDYNGAAITSGFVLGNVPGRAVASIVYNTTNTSIDANFTQDSTIWTGAINSTWDVGTAADVGGTNNFKLASSGIATNFYTGDIVAFDDTQTTAFTVDVPAIVQPNAVTVSNSTNTFTFQGVGGIGGTASLTKTGTGTLVLLTNNTNTGVTTVSAGTLQVGNGGTSGSIGGNLVIAAASTVNFNRSDASTMAGVISGTGTINVNGTGTLTLTAANTSFTGPLNINAGRVILGDPLAGVGSSGDINSTAINVNSGATFQFGLGNVTVGSENPDLPDTTYITVNTGGTVDWRIGEQLGGVNLTGGTINLNGGGITQNGGSVSWTAGTVTGTVGAIGGAAVINKTTSGTVSIGGAAVVNSTINIQEGTVSFLTAANLGTSQIGLGGVAVGTLDYQGLDASRAGNIVLGGDGAVSVASAATNLNLTGVVSGTGTLTKTGPGTLTLSGVNTYTGLTTVSAGRLLTTAPTALPNYNTAAQVAVAPGAILAISAGGTGDWTAANIDTLQTNATFAVGSFLGVDVAANNSFSYASPVTGSKGLVKSGFGTLALSAPNTYTGSTTVTAGTLDASAGSIDSSAGPMAVTNSGSSLIAKRIAPSSLTVDAGASVKLTSIDDPTNLATSRSALGTLANAGLIDVASTGVVIATVPDASVIRAQIVAGRGSTGGTSATWAGTTGIRSSTAATDGTNRAVGYSVNSTTGVVTVAQTLLGDANLDGRVNVLDRAAYLSNAGTSGKTWQQADFNYDGFVNVLDRAAYLAHAGQSLPLVGGSLASSTALSMTAGSSAGSTTGTLAKLGSASLAPASSLTPASLQPAAAPGTPILTYFPTTGKLVLDTNGQSAINAIFLDVAQNNVLNIIQDPDGALGVSWTASFNGALNWESSNTTAAGDMIPGVYEIATLKTGLTATAFGGQHQFGFGDHNDDVGFVLDSGSILNTPITIAAVPEPTAIGLAAIAVTGLLARRRRRA